MQKNAPVEASIAPVRLRCDFLENPLGVQSSHPAFSWMLLAHNDAARGLRQIAYQIAVTDTLIALPAKHFSPSDHFPKDTQVWDSGRVRSSEFIQIPYAGKPLHANRQYFWSVRVWDQDGLASTWSEVATWTMGLLQASDWKAQWVAAALDPRISASPQQHDGVEVVPKPLPVFRKSFRLQGPVERAVVYVCGLGEYELRLNGRKVGKDALAPAWTDYRRRVLYDVYDVTELLGSGENVLGMMLGNGMYNVERYAGRYTKFSRSMGAPALIVQMNVQYRDGSGSVVASDGSWKWSKGPITLSSIYGGEDYDARQEQAGWDEAGFDDSGWRGVVAVSGPGGKLVARKMPPVRVMHEYESVKRMEPRPGVMVFDLGQNFSGWPRLTASGPPGSKVKMIPGELLDSSGLVTQNSSGGPVSFSYTFKGAVEETWHPRFSYYGFRYVQIEISAAMGNAGSEKPVVRQIAGESVYSSAKVSGEFSSSDVLLNRIHGLIDAAIRSNLQSVLTDCPHREKLGWLEESHLLGAALMYDFDLAQFYGKIADDIGDSQLPNGLVPDIAPEFEVFEGGFRDSPEWGSAAVLDPWLDYQFYGDLDVLSQHYGEMRRYVDYLSSRAKGHILSYGLGDWYDIGPGAPGESKLTSRGVTATAIYYLDLTVLRRVALLQGKLDDAIRYRKLAQAVRRAFNAKMFHKTTNQYDSGSQTANAMPLTVGLVPENRRAAVLENLVRDIRAHGNHVTAGDVGFHFVVRALTDGGRSDVLYDMLSRTDSPSYGYQLSQGATSLTEAWDANRDDSQNHFMLGHAEEWFYRGLAGIDFDLSRSRLERVVIRPALVHGVHSAAASYDSILGKIEVEWARSDSGASLNVTIPPGISAIVHVPSTKAITENGKPVTRVQGVKRVTPRVHDSVVWVGSGHYHFSWTGPPGRVF